MFLRNKRLWRFCTLKQLDSICAQKTIYKTVVDLKYIVILYSAKWGPAMIAGRTSGMF